MKMNNIKSNKLDKIFLICIILLLLISLSYCRRVGMKNTYRYYFHETTGDNNFIEINSMEVNFYFSKNSSEEAIASFNSLNTEIKHSWNKNNIYFVGELTGEIKTSKELFPERYKRKIKEGIEKIPISGNPEDKKYFEFTLVNWYIEVPFKQMLVDYTGVTYIDRKELTKDDFFGYNEAFKINKHSKKKNTK